MARVLDELRGGNRGHQSERDALKRICAAWPQAAEAVRRYDRLASDAAARAVREGATAVVFGAAGFPGPGAQPHEAAAGASRSARFYYTGSNDVVRALRARSLAGDSRATALPAGVREPSLLLRAVRRLGAGPGPFMIQFGTAIGFMTAREAAAALARYRDLLPPGSQVLAAVPDGPEGRRLAMLADAEPHSPADVLAWLRAAGFAITGARGPCPASGGRIVAVIGRVP